MTIEARLFDGTILQFPDGTDDSVIDSTVKKLTAERQPKEKEGVLRQAADVPVGVAKGAVQGVRMIADAFGAENPISKNLRGVEDYLGGLMSAQAKDDQQEIARIMKEAEDKGVLDQVKAGIKAFTVAPVDLLSQAFGTIAPVVVGGLAGGALRLGAAATGVATGSAMGAGSIKSNIYDAVKEELSKTNLPPDQIEKRAILAQEYGGQNLDQILLGAGIGGLSAVTGAEALLIPGMVKNIAAKAAAKSTTARAFGTGVKEFGTEGLQGGQEQVAQNIALQREGYNVPTFRGAVGAGTMEGLAGFGMGTGVGAFSRPEVPRETPPARKPAAEPVQEPVQVATEEPAFVPQVIPPSASLQEGIDLATGVAGGAGLTEADLLGAGEAAIQPGQRERAQALAAQQFGLNAPAPRQEYAPSYESPVAAQQAIDGDRFRQQTIPPAITPSQAIPRTPTQPLNAEQMRQRVDEQSALLAQAQNEPFEFDRRRLSTQADVAGGTGQVRGTPRAQLVDVNPMPPVVARQRLAVLKDELARNGQDPNSLFIVPHPTMGGRFAIEQRVTEQPYVAPPIEAPTVSAAEAQQRIESSALAGSERQRLGQDQGRQAMLSRIMRNIDERGGVASPDEAEALRQANMGRPYNRIDYGLARQGSVDERLTQATGLELARTPRETLARPATGEAAAEAQARAAVEERQRLNEERRRMGLEQLAEDEQTAAFTARRAQEAEQRTAQQQQQEQYQQRQAELQNVFGNLPPGPRDVIAALSTPSVNRDAQQIKTVKLAQERMTPNDFSILEMVAENPNSMPNALQRIENDYKIKYSLSNDATPELKATVDDMRKQLLPILKRFGLEKVGLRLVGSIANGGADGMYAKQVITLALDSDNPLGVMRHEVIHALKELGAFTPAEWKVLSKAAKDTWINQFFNRDMQDRYQRVYLEQNGNLDGFQEYLQEEAIAQAFRFYSETKPPSGMIANLMRRLNEFFNALTNFLTGKGFTNIDDMFLPNRIFADIERGAITPGRDQGRKEGVPVYAFKPSKAPEGIPQEIYNLQQKYERMTAMANGRMPSEPNAQGVYPRPQDLKREETLSFRRLNKAVENFTGDTSGEPNGPAMQMLSRLSELSRSAGEKGQAPKYSLRSPAVEIVSGEVKKPEIEGKVTVDKVGQYFDNKIMAEFGRKLDYKNPEDFARAVAQSDDEVAFQLAQENSGLDWYEEDVKKAFEYTAKIIPELESEQKRLLFSVMAGIMSPQTNARDNWFIAAKAFQHYVATSTIPGNNPDTGGLWQGGTQSANKKVQLEFLNKMVADLGEKETLDWLTGQHTVKEVNQFRQKYGNIKSGIGGKATDQVIGLYAFGPKVGPFVSNLNGIFDVTVDKWMTRTFNRYFGTMVDADGKIIDAPTEAQRKAVKQLVNEVAQNANIKPYQVQSLLWFFEQRLFRELGTPAPSYGFSDGGRKFFESATGGNEKGRGNAAAQAPKFSLRAPTTPEFKQWFKGSKIVNPDGTPRLMYHGTTGDITEFKIMEKKNRTGMPDGFYFTASPSEASSYASTEEGSNVVPVYLNVKNPFDLAKQNKITDEMVDAFRKELRKDNPNLSDNWIESKVDIFKEKSKSRGFPFPNISFPTEAMTKIFKIGGYDGLLDGGNHVVAFDSNQIKSAYNLTPTPSPDIRYSLRQQKTPEFKRFFGNSKVVNPDGTPKVMYHGTARVIDEFIPKQAGAVFVTDNPAFAETFAKDSIRYQVQEQTDQLRQAFGNMNPDDQLAFLKKAYKLGVKQKALSKASADQALAAIEQDFANRKYPTVQQFNEVAEFFDKEIRKDLQTGETIMPLYVRAENPFDYENPEHIQKIRPFVQSSDVDDLLKRSSMGFWQAIESDMVQDAIKDAGFDSFYVKEGDQKNLAVYNPNQIKSAIGNRGTFDESGNIRYSLSNAPPNRYTKLAKNDATAGKAVVEAATSAFNAVRNDGTRTSARINLVDRFAGVSKTLSPLPLFSDGVLRADMLHHAKAQGINLIKGGLVSGVPILNDDGTIGIERSENNLARAAYLADKLDTNKNVVDSGLSGRSYVAEVARILRGLDIIEEDKATRALGEQQINDANFFANELKKELKAGNITATQVVQFQGQIDKLREEGNANRKVKRELQVKPEDIAWAQKQLQITPEIQEIFDIWKEVNTSLVNLWEAVGLLDKETADKYRAAKNYVPLFKSREDLNEEGFFRTGTGAKTTAKVKKLEGADITRNIWENIDKQYATMIAAAYENQTRRVSVKQMRSISNDLAEITNPSDPRVNLRYRENGKDVHVVIENPNDLAAFQSMTYQLSPIMKAFGGFTQVLRAGALLNPMFWIRQLIRDPISATLTGQAGIVTPIHSAKEFLSIITRNSEEARILASRGVIGQFDSTVSLQEFLGQVGKEKQKAPNFIQKGLHRLLEIHESSDAATRVAIFKKAKAQALKDGMSESQAIDYAVFKARESINFALTGNSPTLANLRQMIPFLNATIVGLDTLYRAATGYGLNPEEKAKVRKMFATRATMMFVMSLAYAFSLQDDDDYKKLPDYVKDGNWLIPMSTDTGKQFVKVTVPYEVGFLFKTLPELFVRYISGTSTGKEVAASLRAGFIQNMPTGGVPIPQAVRPLAEVVTNYSFFTNRPIEGMGDSRLPVAQRGEKASEFAKMMSGLGLDKISLSPAKIDVLTKGYFAELGSFFTSLADAVINASTGKEPTPKNIDNAFAKAFLTDPSVNKAVSDFYEIERSAQETANLFNDMKNKGQAEEIRALLEDPEKRKQIGMSKALNSIQKSMSDVNKAIRMIDNNQSIPPQERRQKINELQAVLGRLAQRGVEMAGIAGLTR